MTFINRFVFLVGVVIIAILPFVFSINSNMTLVYTMVQVDGKLYSQNLAWVDSPFKEYSNENDGDFRADLVLRNGSIVYSSRFSKTSILEPVLSEKCLNGEVQEGCDIEPYVQDRTYIVVNFPFFREVKSIDVYNGNALLFSKLIYLGEELDLGIRKDYIYFYIIGFGVILLILVIIFIRFMKK